MNDPLSPLTAPPVRYLLESDSEDEEGQGSYPFTETSESPSASASASASRSRRSPPTVSISFSTHGTPGQDDVAPPELDTLIVANGQVGRYLSRKLGTDGKDAMLEVKMGDRVIGKGVKIGMIAGSAPDDDKERRGGLLVTLDELEESSDETWECSKVLMRLEAKSTILATMYLPSMYIPSPAEELDRSSTIPIRYIHVSGASDPSDRIDKSGGVKGLRPPNFVTGLAASMASLKYVKAAHPSSNTGKLDVLSFPLPLSSIPTQLLHTSLVALGPSLGSHLGTLGKSVRTRWTEDDDEPFSAPGMGAKKRVLASGALKEDVSGMYM